MKLKNKNWAKHWKALQDSVLSLMKTQGLRQHLELVLDKAMSLVSCDAGSIYLYQEPNELVFYVMKNRSIDLAPTSPFSMPLDSPSLAAHAFRKGEALNIDDVYAIPKGSPFVFSHQMDIRLKYRSRSMICLPLKNKENKIIGVLQLINRKNEDLEVWPSQNEKLIKKMPSFSEDDQNTLEAFAGIAAAGIENAQLYEGIENLLKSFARASVQAIESRDLATRGHSERVTILTLALVRRLHESEVEKFKDFRVSIDEFEELRLATLLHDFGKIAVPEFILSKEEKLTPIQKLQIELRLERFKSAALKDILAEAVNSKDPNILNNIEFEMKKLDADFENVGNTIKNLSKPTILDDDKSKHLEALVQKTFKGLDGQEQKLLQPEEIIALKILRGSLNQTEKEWMQAHVTYSYYYLREIPWVAKWKNIPELAYGHHELLDGSGYPRKLKSDEISFKVRAMTICDIFDALVANDRAYKAAVPVEKALDILRNEAKAGKLDIDCLNIFINEKVYETPEFLQLLNGFPQKRVA